MEYRQKAESSLNEAGGVDGEKQMYYYLIKAVVFALLEIAKQIRVKDGSEIID